MAPKKKNMKDDSNGVQIEALESSMKKLDDKFQTQIEDLKTLIAGSLEEVKTTMNQIHKPGVSNETQTEETEDLHVDIVAGNTTAGSKRSFPENSTEEDLSSQKKLKNDQNVLSPTEQYEKEIIGDAVAKALNRGNTHKDGELAQSYLIRGATVDRRIKNKIWVGEYVDLNSMLPKNDLINSVYMTSQEGVSTNVSLNQKQTKPIGSFGDWFRLFNTYAAIYLEKFPEESSQILTYMDKIYVISLERPLSYVWRTYDENFRRIRGLIPDKKNDCPWHLTLHDVLTEAREASFNAKFPAGNGFRQSNFRGQGSSPQITSSNQQNPAICNDFNKEKGCTRSSCRFSHRCHRCRRANHPVYKCRVPAAQGSNNAGNPQANESQQSRN